MSPWWLLAAAAAAVVVVLGVLWALPTVAAESRKRALGRWVGLEDLTSRELERVILCRYKEGMTSTQAREELLRRRAIAEELRRRESLRKRSRGAQVARARRARGRGR